MPLSLARLFEHSCHPGRRGKLEVERLSATSRPAPPLAVELIEHIFSFLDLKSLSNASRVCKAFSKARWLYIDASSLRGHLYAVDLAFFIRKQPKVLIVPKLLGSVGAGQALNGFRGDMLELSYSRLHFEANIFFTANSLQGIKVLKLQGCGVTDSALLLLFQNHQHFSKSLEVLDVSENRLTAQSLLSLPHLGALKRLMINDLNLGRHGAQVIAHVLKQCPQLETLHAESIGISPDGLENAVQAMAQHRSLHTLNLEDNDLEAPQFEQLAQGLKCSKSLRRLNLQSNRLGPAGARVVADMLQSLPLLEYLNVSDNRIGDTGISSLCSCLKNLLEFEANFNGITGAGVHGLSQVLLDTKLKKLCLRFNSIGDTGSTCLSQALLKNPALQELDLEDNSITNTGVASFSDSLAVNKNLTHLRLGHNTFGDAGARSLADGLSRNSSLCLLDMSSQSLNPARITQDSAMALGLALQRNQSLRQLILLSCKHPAAFVQTFSLMKIDAKRVCLSQPKKDIAKHKKKRFWRW